MDFLPAAFNALRSYNQFILYQLCDNPENNNKKIKRPLDYKTLQIASAFKTTNWTTIDNALALAKILGPQYGVGFVFTRDDPFFFIDIDNCYHKDTGWSQLSKDILNLFSGGAVEISSSNMGLHIIGTGEVPENHSCRIEGLEFYSEERFVALTGINAIGDASKNFTSIIPQFINMYFNKKAKQIISSQWWSSEPVLGWNGPSDNETLIQRALQSQGFKSIIGQGARFSDLWDANETVLSVIYPPNDSDIYNRSDADAALASHLAFWTGNNAERMLNLMRQSKLMREKYERDDYLPRTIRHACANTKTWLCDKPIESVIPSIQSHIIKGSTFLNAEQQIEFFKECTYVCDDNAILVPGGHLLDQDRFNVMYGGYTMPLDPQNAKIARNPWHAFTSSQCVKNRKVQATCFKPQHNFGEILESQGKLSVNSFWPSNALKIKGDPSLFINHLSKLTPNATDNKILTSYLAACIQYQGTKFQWCPVIQGVEGNGKTFLSYVLARCIGLMYSHFPRADQLTSRFNDWLYRSIFISIEDMRAPSHCEVTMEILKPMITNEYQAIEPKNGKKSTKEVCCNFLINTNHKDGLRKSATDRRFAVFYTPQQTKEDLLDDGMNAEYFKKLHNWVLKENGLAIINHYLSNYTIFQEFNPALGEHAPLTTSTPDAIKNGIGSLEQEIQEAIHEEIKGFRGGWVSSKALDNLINQCKGNWKIPPNRKRAIMQSMGYDWHPYLPDGRSSAIIPADGGRPRLYIKKGHPAALIQDKEEIIKRYIDSQL